MSSTEVQGAPHHEMYLSAQHWHLSYVLKRVAFVSALIALVVAVIGASFYRVNIPSDTRTRISWLQLAIGLLNNEMTLVGVGDSYSPGSRHHAHAEHQAHHRRR